jgi:hypothetical protein
MKRLERNQRWVFVIFVTFVIFVPEREPSAVTAYGS